jgi:diadenosine tetraphosphate (Ap4A) HIT family hydrolase
MNPGSGSPFRSMPGRIPRVTTESSDAAFAGADSLPTAIHRRVSDARAGRDPTVIGRCSSGWAVFGHQQFVPGYLLLLPDPVVPDLNALTPENRGQFLLDMSRLGDALVRATSPVRINYAIFGNVEPALHAHVIPRYRTEPEAMRSQQPWAYDWNAAPSFDLAAAAPLMRQLRAELASLGTLRTP